MTGKQVPVDPAAEIDHQETDGTYQVVTDLAYQRILIANVIFYGVPGSLDRQWVLIDAGVFGGTTTITHAAERRFGKGSRPAAIILTHGHFDHVGTLKELAEHWDVPVFAHALEVPYLNGTASYPPPDPTVGGGLMSLLSRFYPRGPVNVAERLQQLPTDGSVPFMPGWRWIHVPGHTPGQIALWRDTDRVLVAADAFITTKQESAYAVMTQRAEMHGPPMYYTQDWLQARDSVQRLAALEPEFVVTGHGPAMQGEEMRTALHTLARDFDRVSVPEEGKYVEHPATVAGGTAYAPPS
jgi:glyoxylase-like metal-dependent hydrolase (beta-lactamase superfamily II)